MRLFLDTEFNGFGGELISMGIAAEDGREWYKTLPVTGDIHPWVKEHVIPHLIPTNTHYTGVPVDRDTFATTLQQFLRQFDEPEIIADWPADFEHFMAVMSLSGARAGFSLRWSGTMRLLPSGLLTPQPEVPHNALSDARALRDAYLAWEKANG